MQAWITDELAGVELGDARLDARYGRLLDQLSSKPSVSIPAACGGGADMHAAYRFFDNPKATPAKLLAPHRAATVRRCAAHPVVLVPQDTTALELTRPQERVGGPLGDEQHWGLHVHPALAVTPDQVPLGIVHATLWARDPNDFPKRTQARHKPIAAKESHRWLLGYEAACALHRDCGSQVVALSDSEGDIYECFAAWADRTAGPRADFLVRACQDRALMPTDADAVRAAAAGTTAKLWAAVVAMPVRAQRVIQVSKRPALTGDGSKRRQARAARAATVTVQATTVTVQAPWRSGGRKLPAVTVNVVLVREVDPPPDEPPVEWLLVTSLPVATRADVEKVVDYYGCRWLIEVYFHVLKSGCKVEELQLETTERLLRCLTLYLIVAWRVLYLVRLGRACPEVSCAGLLLPEEWQSVWRVVKQEEPPPQPPPLGQMVELIARLGGYVPRPKEPPGAKTMWIGLQRTRDFALMWSLLHQEKQAELV
jgi:hypothetical protein